MLKLLNLGLIQITGSNAEKFLQGQLTCDVRQINNQQINLGAYCNHKGRVLAVFRLLLQDNYYYLLLTKSILENTLNTLKKYGAFSKVTVTDASENFELLINHPIYKTIAQFKDENSWRLFNIQARIPTIYRTTSELFTPHMLNLPQLNAVSFTKGCYLGQEIIARTENLGKTKRQLLQKEIISDKNLSPGDEVLNESDEKVGTIIDLIKKDINKYLALVVCS